MKIWLNFKEFLAEFVKKIGKIFWVVRRVLQKFCMSSKATNGPQTKKKLYSPGYNPLFNKIVIPIEAFFVCIGEFVDAYGILCWVLPFDDLPLRGLSLVLVRPASNHYTDQFTGDFVITFCVSHTVYILMRISLPETFSSIKNWTKLPCSCLDTADGVATIFFSSQCNF